MSSRTGPHWSIIKRVASIFYSNGALDCASTKKNWAPKMTALDMPIERKYGWQLKPTSSTYFEVVRTPNGQLCVVLNHSLLRGCTSEMIHWWFLHFPSLKVKLLDTEGYENSTVPAYLLWHPSDHYGASLKGRLGPGSTSRAGASIHIQEAMQFLSYGWTLPVDHPL